MNRIAEVPDDEVVRLSDDVDGQPPEGLRLWKADYSLVTSVTPLCARCNSVASPGELSVLLRLPEECVPPRTRRVTLC